MSLQASTVGRKIIMAVTGLFMVLYVIAHLLGNYTIFADAINAYAEMLRRWPYVVILWLSRILLLLSVVLHSWNGIVLKLENRKAKPERYAVQSYRSASFAGRTMIWSGLLTGLFIIYHLLHFTFNVLYPGFSSAGHPDIMGRRDVFFMVVRSFQEIGIATVYITGVAALGLHLMHGIESSVQTLGLNNDRTLPVVVKTGMATGVILFLAYAAIPAAIFAGLLR